MKQKGFAPILIVLIFSAIFIAAGAGYWYSTSNKKVAQEPEGIACTMEAKLCPDGSSVGRSGPNCEFAPCPEENSAQLANPASVYCEKQGGKLEIRTGADGGQTGFCKLPDGSECEEWAYFRGECGHANTDVLGWQTYRNNKYGYEISYPGDWLGGETDPNKDVAVFFKEPRSVEDSMRAHFNVWVYDKNGLTALGWWSERDKKDAVAYVSLGQERINGILMYKFKEESGLGNSYAVFEKDTHIFLVSSSFYDDLFNKLISTFKFIEK